MIAPREIGQIVQADLAEVGVDAEIVTQEWTSYVADWQNNGLDAGEYGLAEMSWNFSSPDPAEWLNPNVRTDAHPPGGGFNGSFYSNPEVDDLLTRAMQTFNQDERAALYQQAQVVMREDCPWIFMFSANNVAAAVANLKGLTLNSDPSVVSFNLAYFE
jgi:peptide/nickel transport system substrate-binding protein